MVRIPDQTYWNGEPAEARKVRVIVGPPPKPTWWCAELEGQEIEAVEVKFQGATFYLNNENDEGWNKVTNGRGSPHYRHATIPVAEVKEWAPMIERGDEVLHRPSGETWVVNRTGKDSEGTYVEPAGWPPCRARAVDCDLVEKGKHSDLLDRHQTEEKETS